MRMLSAFCRAEAANSLRSWYTYVCRVVIALIGGFSAQISSMSEETGTTRLWLVTKSESTVRSFGAVGVTMVWASLCTSNGPRTLNFTGNISVQQVF